MSRLGDEVNRILQDIKQNKANAYERLFMVTFNHLKIVALNYLSNPLDADDVISEAFLKVFKYIHSADLEKDGYNWLCKIVQNTAYDYNKRNHVEMPINKIEDHKLFYELDESVLERNDILSIIKTFDVTDQKLFYLKFWEDRSYEEIAKQTGMKKSTVYKRIHVQMKIIKKKLAGKGEQKK